MLAIDNERCAAVFDWLTHFGAQARGPQAFTWQDPFDEQPDGWLAAASLPGLPIAWACRERAGKLRADGRDEDARAAEEAHRQAVTHLKQNLYLQGQLKRELLARLPLEDAAAIMAHALDADRAPLLGRGRLRAARDFVRDNGLFYAEIEQPQTFPIAWPKVFGPSEGSTVQAIGRTAFVGVVADATVRHRSSLVRVGDAFLLDAQDEELDEIPIHLHVDPHVMDRRDDEIIAFEPVGGETLRLTEAVHLGGVPSRAFGHWLIQFLPKYFAARFSGLLPPVPVLIDAECPRSHREALEFFLADDVEIVEMPERASARVERLWLLGDWLYVPLCPVPGQELGPRRLSLPPQATAELVRKLVAGCRLERHGEAGRLFLARRPDRHRKLINHQRIEDVAVRHGFKIVYLEDHSFAEQIALIRGAEDIAGPDGSSHLMCMFAVPGTKLTMLSHPFLENNASLIAILDAVGLDTLLLQGRCVREDVGYRRFSDYAIDEAEFEAALLR
ncbi:protein of unknown function [Beijerinckiaceae bacterium RH AL1]|nr:glycosyltransferase family 61 protein [Beijerinckiaceae bacterium]VVB42761.1 protein of unknown function [Beijerinckiaceae bacterium RH AL8]VVB42771.1 protein of unknown function [Beijerinckiaceae bacterium RH CH11]VVC53489.1 protein of unknown function [Beijerinckiaceae bacterium RH AL1]